MYILQLLPVVLNKFRGKKRESAFFGRASHCAIASSPQIRPFVLSHSLDLLHTNYALRTHYSQDLRWPLRLYWGCPKERTTMGKAAPHQLGLKKLLFLLSQNPIGWGRHRTNCCIDGRRRRRQRQQSTHTSYWVFNVDRFFYCASNTLCVSLTRRPALCYSKCYNEFWHSCLSICPKIGSCHVVTVDKLGQQRSKGLYSFILPTVVQYMARSPVFPHRQCVR